MKQLETTSSPWAVKSGDGQSSPDSSADWTKLPEEVQKKAEEKKKEEIKRTHMMYYLEFPGFGYKHMTGCELGRKPAETVLCPVPMEIRATHQTGDSIAQKILAMEFRLRSASDTDAFYIFTRIRT
jgi:hypothetical protein